MRPSGYIIALLILFISPCVLAKDVAKYDGTRLVQLKFVGAPKFDDGDTIWIDHHKIRLAGIDALEKTQNCIVNGEQTRCAKLAMEQIRMVLSGAHLECDVEIKGDDSAEPRLDAHGRYLAICRRNGEDLNLKLVREGWVFAYRSQKRASYEIKAYLAAEDGAIAAKKGIHEWRPERPYLYRNAKNKNCD